MIVKQSFIDLSQKKTQNVEISLLDLDLSKFPSARARRMHLKLNLAAAWYGAREQVLETFNNLVEVKNRAEAEASRQ